MDLHVGNPVGHGAPTLSPVFSGGAVRGRGYDLGGGPLRVAERAGTPVVGRISVDAVAANPTHPPVVAA
ncbi:hypothetical protein ND486_13165 [Pseudonocardia sp. DR1-2]|uniref:hypothetical protein n=1 Tax=Pseudonocardia sp. DR1-2 TaxID=2951168 RepID=UPI002043F7EC|nr:hypothetical protein [Pseudonocardia sp. DR1-2]MCM3847139.1 hypothetical protein [Pseudonocardia sp. DR1-2]